MNKTIKETFFKAIGYSCGILFTLFAIIIVLFIFKFKILHLYALINSQKVAILNESEVHLMSTFIQKGYIISPENLFERTISYYDSLITILVAIIALIAAFTYFVIKTQAKDHASSEVEKFFSSEYFDLKLEKHVSKIEENLIETYGLDNLDELKRVLDRVNSIDEQVELLESLKPKDK